MPSGRVIKLTSERSRWRSIRISVLQKLGGKCVRCGFSDFRALQIDHVNGGGSKELQEIGAWGVYKKIMNGDIDGYQILCANCNWIKRDENPTEHCVRPENDLILGIPKDKLIETLKLLEAEKQDNDQHSE